jgi:ATP-dependent protease ClpP protease subunit
MNKSNLSVAIIAAITVVIICMMITNARAADPDIHPGNSVYIDGELTEKVALNAGKQILDLAQKFGRNKKKAIYLIINTKGGTLLAGNMLALSAEMVANPVHTVSCFSAGTGFNLVQRLGQRYVAKNGVMVAMQPHYRGGLPEGTLKKLYDNLMEQIRQISALNAARMRVTVEKYDEMTENELWMTGQGAVDKGAADVVVSQDFCKAEVL